MTAKCDWCDKTADQTLPVMVDYGNVFEPLVEEQWCPACIADQMAEEMTGPIADE